MLINLDGITMITLKVWATQRASHQDGRIIQIVLYNCDDDHDIIYWLITSYRVLYIKNLSYINSCILGINVSLILLFIYFTLYWKTIIYIHTIVLVYIHYTSLFCNACTKWESIMTGISVLVSSNIVGQQIKINFREFCNK